MREATGSGNLAEHFRRFAAGARHDNAIRYARICEGIAADPALLELVATAPPDQRRPNILLAAVHYLLLSGADDPLATHYPTVLACRGELHPTVPDPSASDPFPSFAAFCDAHRDELLHLVASRATQTNEVGRCRAILPALSTVGARARAPLAIVDVGAAAGLNLLFDRYAYEYKRFQLADGAASEAAGGAAGEAADGAAGEAADGAAGEAADGAAGEAAGGAAGDPRSPVLLSCEVREGRVPTALPLVVSRIGLDRRPVDIHDDDQVRWLLACQWPDHFDRFDLARRALRLARSLPEAPAVRQGDAVRDLAALATSSPEDAHLCVLHSWVAAYLTPREQRALADAIANIAASRPVSWVFAETPYEVPGLPVPPPPRPQSPKVRGATALVLIEQGPGRAPASHRLADMHAHGRWLHWYGPSA